MKSFSVSAKQEICLSNISKDENSITELAGIILFGAKISVRKIKFSTENKAVFERVCNLCDAIGVQKEISISERYTVLLGTKECKESFLSNFEVLDIETGNSQYGIPISVKEEAELRQSFVRGAFLGSGTINDPNKNYNLEIISVYLGLSLDFMELLAKLGFEFKRIVRKSRYVIYVKHSETILDFLTYLGAYQAQMELINIKIEKEIRNDVNRSINGETANWEKTIDAAVRQLKAIEIIDEKIGIDELPDDLRDIAKLRVKHRSKSLLELGEMLTPPMSKSGVNRRFQRIMAMADSFKEN